MQKHNTMKITRLYTLFALLMVFAVGCNKPDEPNNGENNDDVLVTTFEPQSITINSATCGGKVTPNDGSFILMKGVCWSTEAQPTTDDCYTENGTGAGSFLVEIANLVMNKVYYIRAYAVTADGTTYGNEIEFSTMDGKPEISTTEVNNVTINSAIGGGTVISNGGVISTRHGICWSRNPYPTIEDSHTNDGIGIGDFSSAMTDLEINTIYYVRAYALNDYYTVYGNEISFTTANGAPEVSTAPIVNVSTWSATGGGEVISNGGVTSTSHGVCWSRYPNPTIEDAHTIDGFGIGIFTSSITNLTENTTYYVRAYASNEYSIIYGNEVSFTTMDNNISNHDYVDLGLPSGTLWATCNVGANTPRDRGNFYAWAEIETKNTYEWQNYRYCDGKYDQLTKYCNNSVYGYNGFIDNLTTIESSDDVATLIYGDGWRTPTMAEWEELYQNTRYTCDESGMLFTANNGQSLFLPTACDHTDENNICYGNYWASTLDTNDPSKAFGFGFYLPYGLIIDLGSGNRCDGRFVRPVRSAK